MFCWTKVKEIKKKTKNFDKDKEKMGIGFLTFWYRRVFLNNRIGLRLKGQTDLLAFLNKSIDSLEYAVITTRKRRSMRLLRKTSYST